MNRFYAERVFFFLRDRPSTLRNSGLPCPWFRNFPKAPGYRCLALVFLLSSFLFFTARVDALDVLTLAQLEGEERNGVGGPYVGVLDDRLLVAGGTDFPELPPWRGGQKRYHDAVHILESRKDGSFSWIETPLRLPTPRANGASVSAGKDVYLLGGCDENGTLAECWKISWDKGVGKAILGRLPDLPVPLSFSTASVHNNIIYLAGGFVDEKTGSTSDAFLALDLNRLASGQAEWTTLPPWNGPSRALAVSAVQESENGKAFFLFGGRRYDDSGKLVELTDAWSYRFDTRQWSPVGNVDGLPFQFSAASAVASGTTHILFFGGADNAAFKERLRLAETLAEAEKTQAPEAADLKRQLVDLSENYPGFSDEIRAYNTITKKFFLLARSPHPLPLVTPAVPWQGGFVLAGGETAPGYRSSEILRLNIAQQRSRLGLLNILVMSAYFGVMIGMGFFFSKRQNSTEDYFRGGHRVPWWIVGISLFGTSMSAISYMAVPAKSFMTNWNYLILSVAPLWVAPVIIYFLIPNLRKYDLTSAYEYLEYRFNLATRLLGSFVFMLFQVVRMAVMLFLPAIALNVVTNIDIYLCIGLVGVVSLFYTLFGGIEAVIWTDVLQVLILMGGLVVALYLAVAHLDVGILEAARLAASEHKTSLGSLAFRFQEPTVWTILFASFFLFLIPFSSDQALVQRYFVSKTDREAAGGLWVNAWLTLPCSLLLFALGTALYLFYQRNPTELSVTMSNNDSLFPWFIITQMPPGLSGLVIVAIFAAAMSSLSASVNAISAAYTIDFHQRLFSRSDKPSLFCAKAATLIGGLLGIALAWSMVTWDISSFWDEYNRLMGLISSGLAGIFFLGVLSKRANAQGALIGLIGGVCIQILVSRFGAVHILLYAGTGFTSCIVIGYLASLFFPPPTIRIPVKDVETVTTADTL